MHLAFMFRLTFSRLALISFAFLSWVSTAQAETQIDSIILKAREYEASRILEPVSDSEFHELFGIRSLDLLVKERLAAVGRVETEVLSSPLRDLSIEVLPSIRPRPPLKQRDVLPQEFSILIRPPLPTPALVLAGYDGQPEISELGCATRAHSQHNLAYRCNAPIALNIPGGNKPSKSFLQEMETGCIGGLLMSPTDRSILFLGKMLATTLFLLISQILFIPLCLVLYEIEVSDWIEFGLVLLTGTLGFSSLGTLLSVMTASLRGREMLLPILLFPLVVPNLLSLVHLTDHLFFGSHVRTVESWWTLLLSYNVVLITLSIIGFEFVVEE